MLLARFGGWAGHVPQALDSTAKPGDWLDFLQPMGIGQLFGIPGRLMVNQEYAAIDMIGKSIFPLWEQMAANKCFNARVRMVEGHLMRNAARTLPVRH